jgi:hypothetical protein
MQPDLKAFILDLLNAHQDDVPLVYEDALTVAVETLFRIGV